MNENIVQTADKIFLFSGLSRVERAGLIHAARIRKITTGEHLFYHGDAGTHFFIVISGAVRIHRETPEGKDITIHMAMVGDMLGDHEMIENRERYQYSVVASEDSVLLEYPMSWIRKRISVHTHLALNMLAVISKNSSRMAIDKEHLFTLKAPQRIGCFLIRLCVLHQLAPSSFILPYNKATIASKLGMEPESFSRALVKLKEIGVSVSGNEISISDIEALDDYACGSCSVSEDCKIRDNLYAQYGG